MVFSNTQYLKIENRKLIGYESGIEKYFGFGLGIGYLLGTHWYCLMEEEVGTLARVF